jgi:hypothetical protein
MAFRSSKPLITLSIDNEPFAFIDLDADNFFAGEPLGASQPRSETGVPLSLSKNDDASQSSVASITGDIAFFEDAGNGVPLIPFLTAGGVTTGGNIVIGLEDGGNGVPLIPFLTTGGGVTGPSHAGKGSSHPLPLGEAGGVTTGRNILIGLGDIGPPIETAPFATGNALI